ncbi:hypothetical protein ACFFX1_36655 [Dactylosporangium sucinum]|uniref:Uncharacterized protein n=1 Tax=Dactylosporangium sucinum TaxID=1424081 RepID=A0A917TTY9_9ACTN|nr:hypothetical protein [Dactylosporangium sucinum]GGM37224.1 hypothetical protein GCM10007977_043290 [Dactylosporangium sucinum]
MSALDSVTAGPRPAAFRRLAPLIGRETLRLARHPVLWLIPAVVVVTTSVETASDGRTAGYWYGTVFTAIAFFSPLFVLFAANLAASSARRSRAEEMLHVTPTTDTRRTWAMSLGVALPLAGAGAVGAGAMALIDSVSDIPTEDLLTAGELAQLPFVLAGAGLLGVLAARWLPFAGGALITFVAATLGGVVVFRRFDAGVWWMWWTTETTFEGRSPVPGEPWLHVAYLAGLCACATVAAVYRDRTQWTRLVLVGAPVVAATLALGWLQLP